MKPFLSDDFLLETQTAKDLYHNYAKKMRIIDFHSHLSAKEIYEDKCYQNITQAWLSGDHYKWRAMRAYGVPEAFITGNADPYDKFFAWAETVQNLIGNPLYHWTHLELKRYFGIQKSLSPATAKEIWEECNAKLKTPAYSIRNLLKMQNVEIICTTDDPMDDLEYHKKLKDSGFPIRVLPTFRPEKVLAIEKEGFFDYIEDFCDKTRKVPHTIPSLLDVLRERLDFFMANGCHVTDNSLENDFYEEATLEEVEIIYQRRLIDKPLTKKECAMYHGYMLKELGKEYAKRNLVMQLHIGALRNNSTRLFDQLGADTGLDSIHDFSYATSLSRLLDSMDKTDELPKTVLYYLNPKDADMLAAMAGNFQSNNSGIKGKVQLGSAWWFCDHKSGMEHQMEVLSRIGLLSTFIGMLTDSRSFLSFPRHEYFRRILCNKVGSIVENGEYPKDMEFLGKLVENISYYNAKQYFTL